MATAQTARLIASLELNAQKFAAGVKVAETSIGKLETRFGKIGGIAKQGLGTAAVNIAKIGLIAGAGIGAAVKTGLDDLATLESAITATDGAIKQMGLTGQVTGKQVSDWANQIESNIGAAFDDKDITAATATLIRFGKVTPGNLRPAMVVMTDLATKTGSVDSAAQLLAKALADPEKAAGKLARSGVVLTKAQQDQIKAMVKVGNVAGAQKYLLDELAKATTGAAATSQGPYQRALSVLADVSEDARKALAEGFLPVLEKLAGKLSTALADPKVIGQIREFGKGLAGSLDDLIGMAEKLPWATIGDSLKTAGQGARVLLDAFTKLPPWIQTAVITGWGLNKLTGGALGGIVGELGKGLIKGVLGMTAGVVNIKAGVVNGGGGGIPGVPAAGAGAATAGGVGLGTIALAAGSIVAIGTAVEAAFLYGLPSLMNTITGNKTGRELDTGRKLGLTDTATRTMASLGLGNLMASATKPIAVAVNDMRSENRVHTANQTAVLDRAAGETRSETIATRRAVEGMVGAERDSLVAFRASERGIVGAIGGIKAPSVQTNVTVNVTAASVSRSVTVHSRYGPPGGSAATGANARRLVPT